MAMGSVNGVHLGEMGGDREKLEVLADDTFSKD